MNYSRNAVYNYVVNAVKPQFPLTNFTSRRVPKPASFPTAYIHEIDNFRTLEATQLDFEDVQCESVFEVQVKSAKGNEAASEAFSIMESVSAAMSELYYRKFSETTVDTGEWFTVIARFRRKIGGGDTMPNN